MNTHRTPSLDQLLSDSIKRIEDLKHEYRKHPAMLVLLDDQSELLMDNASQMRTQENLRAMVKSGKMSDFQASIISGSVSLATIETMEKIHINTMLIKHVMKVLAAPPSPAAQQFVEA